MKKILFVTIIVCLLISCSKEDLSTVNAHLGKEIRLKEGQAALYNNSGIETAPTVRLKVEDVSDSRCPSDVVCVTYGKVDVRLILGTGNGIGETITMCLGDCAGGSRPEDVAEVMVGGIPYKIRLLSVSPLPSLKDSSNKNKEVQLVLERR